MFVGRFLVYITNRRENNDDLRIKVKHTNEGRVRCKNNESLLDGSLHALQNAEKMNR